MRGLYYTILALFIQFWIVAQDRDLLLEGKQKHLFQSENYFFLDETNQPVDSAFYIIGGVYSEKRYAYHDNKRIRLMFPESKVIYNKQNNRYYIAVSQNTDVDATIKTLKSLRSMYEPLAWVLIYY